MTVAPERIFRGKVFTGLPESSPIEYLSMLKCKAAPPADTSRIRKQLTVMHTPKSQIKEQQASKPYYVYTDSPERSNDPMKKWAKLTKLNSGA